MTTWFVTRHHGAVFWAADYGVKVNEDDDKSGKIVADLDVARVKKGDEVIGTLPIHMEAAVIKRGASYTHLSMEIPTSLRGKELTKEQMRECGARLERFDIKSLGRLTKHRATDEITVMVAIASGQILQNVLPLLAMKTMPSHLYLLVSSDAQAKASAAKVAAFCTTKGVPHTVISDMPDSSLDEIQRFVREKCVSKIQKEFPKARIVLNATGGNKMMSSGAASIIERFGDVIYCDTANERIEYFCPSQEHINLQPGLLSLDDYFSAQGLRILSNECASRNKSHLDQIEKFAFTTREIVRLLAGRFGGDVQNSIGQLNFAAMNIEKQSNEKGIWEPSQKVRGVIDKRLAEVLNRTKNLGVKIERNVVLFSNERTPDAEAAISYLKGGWLEHYCFLVMRDINLPQKYWDCNVKIDPADMPPMRMNDGKEVSINEIDLAVTWHNRVLLVECKTGRQLEQNSKEIIPKLKAIRDYAGGTMAEAMVLSSNNFTRRDGAPTVNERNARVRAQQGQPIILHTRDALAQWETLVREWLGNDFVKTSEEPRGVVSPAQLAPPKAETMKADTQKKVDVRATPKLAPAKQPTEVSGRRREPRKSLQNTALGDALKRAASKS